MIFNLDYNKWKNERDGIYTPPSPYSNIASILAGAKKCFLSGPVKLNRGENRRKNGKDNQPKFRYGKDTTY